MPELAEVKIMADFINNIAANQFFERLEKSEVSKVKTELEVFDGGIFTIKADSRGKELKLIFELIGGGPTGEDIKTLIVTLGMSGSWAMVRHDSPEKERVLKHSHLKIITTRGDLLVLHDVRRFAKWRWGTWGKDRSPCPLTEYNEFATHIRSKWESSKAFTVPLNELLLNQSYFNGVGNYLRAEILSRMSFSPFTISNTLNRDQLEALLKMVYFCVKDSYYLGGGRLKDWINPNGVLAESMQDWLTTYGKGSSIIDRTGRRFWFDPAWETDIPEMYKRPKPTKDEGDI